MNDKNHYSKANIFFNEFYRLISKELCKKGIENKYKYDRSWTSIMTGEKERSKKNLYPSASYGIIGETIKGVFGDKIEIAKEYYRIDMIGYFNKKDNLPLNSKHMKKYYWDFAVAIEHENKSRDWLDEVCKLSYIRCPLRVIISYNVPDKDDALKDASKILKTTNAFTDKEQEFLIILGKNANNFSRDQLYKGYLLNLEKINSGFENIIALTEHK